MYWSKYLRGPTLYLYAEMLEYGGTVIISSRYRFTFFKINLNTFKFNKIAIFIMKTKFWGNYSGGSVIICCCYKGTDLRN